MNQKNINTEREVFIKMFQELFTLLSKLHRISEDLLVHSKSDMTHSCWVILSILGREDTSLTVPQIAELRSTSRQAVQRQISILLELGYIESLDNPKNKRSPLYVTTNKGHDYYKTVSEVVYGDWLNTISNNIGQKEGEKLLASLKELDASISAIPVKGSQLSSSED